MRLSGVFMQIFNTASPRLRFSTSLAAGQRRGLRGSTTSVACAAHTAALWVDERGMFSSLGLPGLNGFIGEFLIFKGHSRCSRISAIAVIGLLVTASSLCVLCNPVQRALAEVAAVFQIFARRKFVIVPVTLLMFAIGIAPQFLFNIFNTTVATWRNCLVKCPRE